MDDVLPSLRTWHNSWGALLSDTQRQAMVIFMGERAYRIFEEVVVMAVRYHRDLSVHKRIDSLESVLTFRGHPVARAMGLPEDQVEVRFLYE